MSHLISGKAYWFKAVGAPVPMFEKPLDAPAVDREWSFDLCVDKEQIKELKKLGVADKLKNSGDERGDYLTLKRRAIKADGVTANSPIRVVDHHGKPWRNGTKVGNGSTINVRINVYDGRRGKKPVVLAVQVWDFIPYVPPVRPEGQDGQFPVKQDADTEEVAF